MAVVTSQKTRRAVLRLRVGLAMFVLSWMPFPQLYISLAGLHGSAADTARVIGWTIEWIVGLAGLALAGTAARTAVKKVGWRRLPKTLWLMVRSGNTA